MEIICTKEEFACLLEKCCENRNGGIGCGGCLFDPFFPDNNTTCSFHLINACKIVSTGKVDS